MSNTSDIKLCKDCRHHISRQCYRPNHSQKGLVSGELYTQLLCKPLRDNTYCGRTGKLCEPIPQNPSALQRFVAWIKGD